jgi:Putative prokaryotic signal transducing protein
MTLIKTYSSRIEADLASIALSAAGITATIIGVGVSMEGGAEGVRLMVPDDQADAAFKVLAES